MVEAGGKWLAGLIGYVGDPGNQGKASAEFDKWGALAVLWIAHAATEIKPHFDAYLKKLEEAMGKVLESMKKAAWEVVVALVQSMIDSLYNDASRLGNAIQAIIGREVARGIREALLNLGVAQEADDTEKQTGGSSQSTKGMVSGGVAGGIMSERSGTTRGATGNSGYTVYAPITIGTVASQVDVDEMLRRVKKAIMEAIARANAGFSYGY